MVSPYAFKGASLLDHLVGARKRELMIRMLLIGYCFGISERRLCDEVHLNLAYWWFCRSA